LLTKSCGVSGNEGFPLLEFYRKNGWPGLVFRTNLDVGLIKKEDLPSCLKSTMTFLKKAGSKKASRSLVNVKGL